MTKDDFLQKLETMSKPYVTNDDQRLQLKMTLTNAQRSSRIGYLLITLPCLFLLGLLLKYFFNLNLGVIEVIENWMYGINQNPFLKFLMPLILTLGPLIGMGLNLLAISHFVFNKKTLELQINLKFSLSNLIAFFVSAGVLFVYVIYLISQNFYQLQHFYEHSKGY
jgi:hypothetical protein